MAIEQMKSVRPSQFGAAKLGSVAGWHGGLPLQRAPARCKSTNISENGKEKGGKISKLRKKWRKKYYRKHRKYVIPLERIAQQSVKSVKSVVSV